MRATIASSTGSPLFALTARAEIAIATTTGSDFMASVYITSSRAAEAPSRGALGGEPALSGPPRHPLHLLEPPCSDLDLPLIGDLRRRDHGEEIAVRRHVVLASDLGVEQLALVDEIDLLAGRSNVDRDH